MRLANLIASTLLGVLVLLVFTTFTAVAADPSVEDDGKGGFTGSTQVDYNDTRRGNKEKANKPSDPGDRKPSRPKKQSPDPSDCDPSANCRNGSVTAVLSREGAESYARQLIVRLQLPTPTPQFGPDPSVNEWKMLAVGYPIWLWTEGPTTVTATESAYGYTFTLRARYRSTTFAMGDNHTRQCTATTPYRKTVEPGTKSPTCGYTYQVAARDGTYTVTATTHWDVEWSVAGYSGTLPGTHSASRELPIGELQAIRVR